MRGSGVGQEWAVTNKGQQLVGNVGVIRESGEHQSEEEKGGKGNIIAQTSTSQKTDSLSLLDCKLYIK